MINLQEFIKFPPSVEEIDLELYQRLALPEGVSKMADHERLLIHGICRLHKPRRILEIGVFYGGGSAVLLNAISDRPEAKMISIDIVEDVLSWDGVNRVPTGYAAKELFPDNNQWELCVGKDPVEVIEYIAEEKFDLCVIDTAHLHPVEVLNFLTVFPFLKTGAIVIIHDVSLHVCEKEIGTVSPHLLYISTIADKLVKKRSWYNAPNVGVLQIRDDTAANIHNVFLALNFRCFFLPQKLQILSEFFERHYDETCNILYNAAVRNAIFAERNQYITHGYQQAKDRFTEYCKKLAVLDELIDKLDWHNRLVIYGGGNNCKNLLRSSLSQNSSKPHEIWDINAESIGSIEGIPVVLPKWEKLNISGEYGVIIAITDWKIVKEVESRFIAAGFTNYVDFLQ